MADDTKPRGFRWVYSIDNNGQRLQNKEQAKKRENYVKTIRIGNNGAKNEEQIKMVWKINE